MVIEDDHFHPRLATQTRQVSDPLGVGGVDDDELADLCLIEQTQVDDGEALPVQGDELPHVGVQRTGKDDVSLRVEQRGSHDGCQSVEIRVLVGRDDRRCFKQ